MVPDNKPDTKKDDKKPTGPVDDPFAEIVGVIVTLMVVTYLVNGLIATVNSSRLLSNGWQGLTPRGILLAHTKPISSLSNPIGAKVISVNQTDVYNLPAGERIGEQKITAHGKILQGPVFINGERYWYVDYEEDSDGWVKENDIAYLEAEPNLLAKIAINILGIVWYIKILLLLISVIFIFCIIYLFRKVMSLSIVEARKLYPESYFNGTSLDLSVASAQINPKWQKIQDHVESINENNWKLAIIEADIMLGEVLDNLSLPGETIGDKLKAVERSDFTTVDLAWEAHKIRNQIAHEGSSFLLNQRETKRILSLYQAVFEEFHII
ncbi:MAG: hypothetical protein A3H52_00985 [Candidatus Zambryskibacteria bacterium RIFCSPLOWO2_02_FULL_39_26]|uniref:Uncharacterized protein n=1 Tax=Candidatus Zambryskibacteria bacterium RIFCSPLOWO2_12_FULL_39_23 TaxID=1802776 RepID=A0A1G2UUE8_9BACT|nr:MAG: hypothetical protein A2W51_01465 [Candidatus Zambryskibacteria bacterium RIFCSPHIGHO2_02_39_10]OHB09969.1 MAG: hypothetical protein A3H52_00985 [Candidatus Zambryskibacteria bacterium RIFCSPLOWO2_02_FULL_39_26]OHB13019.1 MAG: hypothetical protein A3G99_00400 [Candidatus Zambryskibacteria bacterium RIFCSPLOWO2_12_FULL_39_23]